MKIWIVWGVFCLVYITLNSVAIVAKAGIPGMPTMIGWGFLMPILMVIAWWVAAVVNKAELGKQWWVMGLLSTAVFAIAGLISVNVIGAIWASI